MDHHTTLPWTLAGLDLAHIDLARVRHDENLFFLLCSVSFAERDADLRTRQLIEHYAGDQELQTWLSQHWEHEELQRGHALTAYVRHVWPEFDWDSGFTAYQNACDATRATAPLEASRGLELAARCAVKTHSAGLYRALHEITDEPVLKQLAGQIRNNELSHYKHFYRHYCRYREHEGFGRYQVFRAILRRVNALRREDSDLALRHVFAQCCPQHRDDAGEFRRVSDRAQGLLRRHMPADTTVKMLLKPLELPPRLQAALEKPLAKFGEKWLPN